MGNVTRGNTLQNNGGFGNPTNADLANQSSSNPPNCFYGNRDPDGLTSEPPMIETVDGQPGDAACTGSAAPTPQRRLGAQVSCSHAPPRPARPTPPRPKA